MHYYSFFANAFGFGLIIPYDPVPEHRNSNGFNIFYIGGLFSPEH